MKKIAITQSNFIPWRGYFKLIDKVDEFVIFDSAQYTRRDWRNRNKIKTNAGSHWLTVPIQNKGNYLTPINEMRVDGTSWKRKHLQTIQTYYKLSPFFDEVYSLLEASYDEAGNDTLSVFNIDLINRISNYFGIDTKISLDNKLPLLDDKNMRLIEWCKILDADVYFSGKKAQDYIDLDKFENNNLKVKWFDYGDTATYKQLWGEFIPNLSVIDLMFNVGKKARAIL
ncbi:WbqC family protein [Alphaproteobacteria bacterium]|nr:WbqC family protein [Alphaproteobacteria bacterium]